MGRSSLATFIIALGKIAIHYNGDHPRPLRGIYMYQLRMSKWPTC